VREGTVLDICDHLFDDGVPPVITLGILQRERGVGEGDVVAPGIEERALSSATATASFGDGPAVLLWSA
jgi:hypothetical protein